MPDRLAHVSYLTGHDGSEMVNLLLKITKNGFVLTADLPPQALTSIEGNTKEDIPETLRNIFIFSDEDMDGWPDGFKFLQTSSADDASLEKMQYTPIDVNDAKYNGIILQWGMLMAISTNSLLRGVISTSAPLY